MKQTIMIVDDVTAYIRRLQKILSNQYDIITAQHGLSALELIEENNPDLFLIDTVMPGINGFQLCEKIKRIQRFKDTPVILMTSRDEAYEEILGLKMGAMDFIKKPFREEIIRQRIKNQLKLKAYKNDIDKSLSLQEMERSKLIYSILKSFALIAGNRFEKENLNLQKTLRYIELLLDIIIKNNINEKVFKNYSKEDLIRASTLYDIGKIMIPDKILFKKTKLTEIQNNILKNYVEYSYEIINSLRIDKPYDNYFTLASQIACSHHEWWNGEGFPRGLKENQIPYMARIVSIAEQYNLLTAGTIRDKKVTHNEAIEKINNLKGKQFDPILVELFNENEDLFNETMMELNN